MKIAAAIDPARLPMPPTTTTMKAFKIQSSPIAWLTPTSGPNSTPLAPGRQIYSRTKQGDHQTGDGKRDPEITGGGQHDHADISAEHEELAMGEIDDLHNAKNQGQPRGHQRQDHAGDDAVDGLDQQLIKGISTTAPELQPVIPAKAGTRSVEAPTVASCPQ